jgi:hypothetical protein
MATKRPMTEKQDARSDRKAGIKEDSARDMRKDKRMGVMQGQAKSPSKKKGC